MSSADAVALYDAALASLGVERKGASMPYTSVNGNMFSFVAKDGAVALRLGAADRAAFLAEHQTTHSVQHGVTQKEYVVAPPKLVARTADLAAWLTRSLAYATSLPAKATTRAASAKATPTRSKPARAKPAAPVRAKKAR